MSLHENTCKFQISNSIEILPYVYSYLCTKVYNYKIVGKFDNIDQSSKKKKRKKCSKEMSVFQLIDFVFYRSGNRR